jgi:hypothetical protein
MTPDPFREALAALIMAERRYVAGVGDAAYPDDSVVLDLYDEAVRERDEARAVYESAVAGRQQFRHALMDARAEADRLREALQAVYDDLDDRYDGAPDSLTKWMSHHIAAIHAVLDRQEPER